MELKEDCLGEYSASSTIFPKYMNDCIIFIKLHESTEMKVVGKFVGIGTFANKKLKPR